MQSKQDSNSVVSYSSLIEVDYLNSITEQPLFWMHIYNEQSTCVQ